MKFYQIHAETYRTLSEKENRRGGVKQCFDRVSAACQ